MKTAIEWHYFFGGHSNGGRCFDRYYSADINGARVERHDSNKGRKYSIGNMDLAKVKYNTEEELIAAISTATFKQNPLRENRGDIT